MHRQSSWVLPPCRASRCCPVAILTVAIPCPDLPRGLSTPCTYHSSILGIPALKSTLALGPGSVQYLGTWCQEFSKLQGCIKIELEGLAAVCLSLLQINKCRAHVQYRPPELRILQALHCSPATALLRANRRICLSASTIWTVSYLCSQSGQVTLLLLYLQYGCKTIGKQRGCLVLALS